MKKQLLQFKFKRWVKTGYHPEMAKLNEQLIVYHHERTNLWTNETFLRDLKNFLKFSSAAIWIYGGDANVYRKHAKEVSLSFVKARASTFGTHLAAINCELSVISTRDRAHKDALYKAAQKSINSQIQECYETCTEYIRVLRRLDDNIQHILLQRRRICRKYSAYRILCKRYRVGCAA